MTTSFGYPTAQPVTMSQELRLDDNMLRVLGPRDLGPHAGALQTLSMSGSMFTTVSSLCRASCVLQHTARAPVLAPDAAAVEQHTCGWSGAPRACE